MDRKKKDGVAILISDKIDFKTKGHKQRPRKSFHNSKKKNPSGGHKHCMYIYTMKEHIYMDPT